MSSIFQFSNRVVTSLGLICLAATFLLLSPGVRAVRADDEALMSTDPALEAPLAEAPRAQAEAAAPRGNPPAAPFVRAEDAENAIRPGVPGIEVEPGVIVLNTRGYNYGPPPTEIDPAALRVESGQR